MSFVTRNTDISVGISSYGGKCCPHVWVSVHTGGSNTVRANGKAVMRAPGDEGSSTDPHSPTSMSLTGATRTFVDGRSVHRLGDLHMVTGGVGVVVSASPNVTAE